MELCTADPVPTSVRFYLAALLSNSAGTEICRCFFFLLHKQMHQAKPSQAADGRRCLIREEKMFCSGPSCAFGRDVFSANCLNKVSVMLFLGFLLVKQAVVCVLPSRWS